VAQFTTVLVYLSLSLSFAVRRTFTDTVCACWTICIRRCWRPTWKH